MARPDSSSKSSQALMLAAIAIVITGLYFAQDVLIPFALAALLAFLLAPLVTRLERLGTGRIFSVIIIVLLSFGLLGVVGWVVTGQLVNLANRLPEYRENIISKVDYLRRSAGGFSRSTDVLKEISKAMAGPSTLPTTAPTTAPASTRPAQGTQLVPNAADEPVRPISVVLAESESSPIAFLRENVSPLFGPLATAGIVIVFVVFILLQREDLRDRLIRLVSHGRLLVTTQAMDDAAQRISRYLLMQLAVNVTYGIPIGVGLWLIGVPNAILWGLLATVLRFLPYVGPWLAAGVPILLAFAAFDTYTPLFLTIGLYVVIELISNNVVEPWLYGASTGMSPVAILVAAVFWTWLWGPIGLLLSTPLTVCLVVIGKYVPQLSFLRVMLGDESVLSPSMRLYQRLLAMDRHEVEDLVAEYMKDHTLLETYDQLLIPALGLSEQDRHGGRVDEKRQQFIRETIRAMVEKFGKDLGLRDGKVEDYMGATATEQNKNVEAEGHCVFCLPASDEADEIVALMLAQVLTPVIGSARYVPTTVLASEMVQIVGRYGSQVVCISALPPASVARARYLCKRLRQASGDLRLVFGLWTVRGDPARLRSRLACSDGDAIVSTLADAVSRLQPLVKTLPRLETRQ